MKATVTCPRCGAKTSVEVPENACLTFYKCSGCREIVGVPKDSETCCVVCAYSNEKCPVSTVK